MFPNLYTRSGTQNTLLLDLYASPENISSVDHQGMRTSRYVRAHTNRDKQRHGRHNKLFCFTNLLVIVYWTKETEESESWRFICHFKFGTGSQEKRNRFNWNMVPARLQQKQGPFTAFVDNIVLHGNGLQWSLVIQDRLVINVN